MFSEFIDGLQNFHFLQNALITAIVIGIVAGAVGCFIILRGMSLMGDAISHAVLPGVALSFILGINFFIGAIVFGLLASVIITYIKGNSIIKSDTAIGITFSSFLALGVILIGVANISTDLFHILFGNILAVQDIDMWITIGVGIAVLIIIGLFFILLGFVGLLLPVAPQVPFFIIGAICLMKSSNRIRDWVKQHALYKKHCQKFMIQ